MKFKLINEGVRFIDVKRDKDGNFIDAGTGLPAEPSRTEIFWDRDEDALKASHVGGSKKNPRDIDPDDIDPDDFDPEEIEFDPDVDGTPFPIMEFLEKLIKLIGEKNGKIRNADAQLLGETQYNKIDNDVSELLKLLGVAKFKSMLNIAKNDLLPAAESLSSLLKKVNYFEDHATVGIVNGMIKNIKVLIKILEHIKDGPGQSSREYYIDGDKKYIKKGDNDYVEVRSFGTHEV